MNPAAEVAANVENQNNAVKVNAPKMERRREYNANKRHEIPALWKVLGKAPRVCGANQQVERGQGKLHPTVYARPLRRRESFLD